MNNLAALLAIVFSVSACSEAPILSEGSALPEGSALAEAPPLSEEMTLPENSENADDISSSAERSATFDRTDLSFSEIRSETVLSDIRKDLSAMDTSTCLAVGECQWQDASGVRHHFLTDGHDEPWLAMKSVAISETDTSPIAALSIGAARSRQDVLSNVQAFAPELEWECDADTCSASVLPGWITLTFNSEGVLSEIRFDAGHFI